MNAVLDTGWIHRPMQTADLDAVLAVELASYPFPWTRGNFVDSLAAGYETDLLQDRQGQVLGYRVSMVGVDEMHLLNLTVRPDCQGRGLARAMLERLEADCHRLALASLWLEVRPSNARARALYLRHGFHEVGLRRAYYPAAQGRREDAIVMSRPVASGPPSHGLD